VRERIVEDFSATIFQYMGVYMANTSHTQISGGIIYV